ncbi:hypothetical protein [Streptomyces californicus]
MPDDLSNIEVTVEWNPGGAGYEVSIVTSDGELLAEHKFMGLAGEPIGYAPLASDFDALVMRGLEGGTTLPARLTRTLAQNSHFAWIGPAEMSREGRETYGVAA